jgi:hypothetical protein
MPIIDKAKILLGRQAVDAYREAHRLLYEKPWHRGIPEEHTPLLNTTLDALRQQGLNSLEEFFAASEELNIQELGFQDKADFETKASEADIEALEGMWC